MKTKIETSKAPKAIGPYSQGLTYNNFVFTSGQIYLMPNGKLVEGTIEKQTRQVMKNLEAILGAADTSFRNVIKTTVYITDMSEFQKVNAVYKEYMVKPYPARETVGVKELPLGVKIEISMVAVKPA